MEKIRDTIDFIFLFIFMCIVLLHDGCVSLIDFGLSRVRKC